MGFGVFSTGTNRWPGVIVPYQINSNDFPINPPPGQPNLRQIINNAITTWNSLSVVQLVPRAGQPDFAEFVRATLSCQSPFGRQGGRQTISCDLTSGFTAVTLMHEIGHCLGLLHEHQRPDQNNFISINTTLPPPSRPANAVELQQLVPINSGWVIGNYDCSSLMHYPANVNLGGGPTPIARITPTNLVACPFIAPAPQPNAGDLAAINLMYGRYAPPGANVAISKQVGDILTSTFFMDDGSLAVAFVRGTGQWRGPIPITGPNLPLAGAPIAMAKQTDDVLTALFTDNNGSLSVAFVVGTGQWQGPIPFGGPQFKPGSSIAMAKQTDDILTALCVGGQGPNSPDGFLNVAFVIGTGQWQGPIQIGDRLEFLAGAPVAIAKQTSNQLTALCVDKEGFLNAAFVIGTGQWQGPIKISNRVFPALTPVSIAMAKQTDNLLTAFAVDGNGMLSVFFVVGTGQWQGPFPISGQNFAPPGASIAMAKQTNDVLTALVVGNDGALSVAFVVGTGQWQGPFPLTGPNFAPPGAPIAMAKQTDDVLTALLCGSAGTLSVAFVVGTGQWQGPFRIG